MEESGSSAGELSQNVVVSQRSLVFIWYAGGEGLSGVPPYTASPWTLLHLQPPLHLCKTFQEEHLLSDLSHCHYLKPPPIQLHWGSTEECLILRNMQVSLVVSSAKILATPFPWTLNSTLNTNLWRNWKSDTVYFLSLIAS